MLKYQLHSSCMVCARDLREVLSIISKQHCELIFINCTQILSKTLPTFYNYFQTLLNAQGKNNLLSRSVSQAHWSFLKKRWRLISSTPFLPNLTSLNRKGRRKVINHLRSYYNLYRFLCERTPNLTDLSP